MAFFLALLLAACDGRDILVDTEARGLPVTVDLKPGQSLLLPRERASIRFEGITADSRCPEGAMCVWAGDAAAWLSIRELDEIAVSCTLHTTLSPQQFLTNTLFIKLKKVDPYPKLDGQIDPASYLITLAVDSLREVVH